MFVTGSSNTSILELATESGMVIVWMGTAGCEDADRDSPWPEDATLPGSLNDVMVRTGVAMNRIVIVVCRVHVVVVSWKGHGGG